LENAKAALALSLEAIKGWIDPFDARIHKVRRHPGQAQIAMDIRALVRGSRLCRSIGMTIRVTDVLKTRTLSDAPPK